MFVWRIAKWALRRIAGRAIPRLSTDSLSSVVDGLLGKDGSGLKALLEKFSKGGLGKLADSWVGKGANLPLSTQQVKSILGDKALSGIAGQLGVSEEVAASKVAKALPQLVNKLTPDGTVPNQAAVSKRLAELLK
jgi:uncharacterized protein YidB (DUF937 family)